MWLGQILCRLPLCDQCSKLREVSLRCNEVLCRVARIMSFLLKEGQAEEPLQKRDRVSHKTIGTYISQDYRDRV